MLDLNCWALFWVRSGHWDPLCLRFGAPGSAPHRIQDTGICFVLDLGFCVLACVRPGWGQGPAPGRAAPNTAGQRPEAQRQSVCLSITTQRGTALL